MARLGDVCNIRGGYAFKSDLFSDKGIPVVRISNITESGLEIDDRICFEEAFWEKNKNYRVNYNDILVAMSGATVGKSCINKNDDKLLLNQRVASISAGDSVENEYVYYFISSPAFTNYVLEQSVGCAQPNISIKQLSDIDLRIPTLKEQSEIVKILVKTDELICVRKKQLSKLDELVKSRFAELFGDVVHCPKYIGVKLGSICTTLSGGTPTTKIPEYYQGDIPWISTPYLGNNHINGKNAKAYITEDAIENSSTHLIPANTIMFGIRVGVGKSSIIDEPMCANQDVVALMNIDINKYDLLFIKHVLDAYQNYFDSIKKGATILGVTTDDLKQVVIPSVDMELQKQFTSFVEQTDKLKFEVKESLEKLETLKKALMQEYFG